MLDDDWSCPVLDGIPSGQEGPMNALLTETVPANGPQVLLDTDMSKPLRDDIYEFRKNPRGAKIRVLWFYGETGLAEQPLAVVCTHSFLKDERVVPGKEIERAILIRERYFADQKRDANEVYDFENGRVR